MGKFKSASLCVLLIGGVPEQVNWARATLEKAGRRVHCAADGQQAAVKARSCQPRLLIWCGVPGTGSASPADYVGFSPSLPELWLGEAPDFSNAAPAPAERKVRWLPWPADPAVLVGMVDSLLSSSDDAPRGAGSRVLLDLDHRRCLVHNVLVRLSPTEFRLLATLVRHPNLVLSQRDLLREVWGPEYLATSTNDIVRQAVRSLRMKLKRQQLPPGLIETVRGQGYVYRWPRQEPADNERDADAEREEWAND